MSQTFLTIGGYLLDIVLPLGVLSASAGFAHLARKEFRRGSPWFALLPAVASLFFFAMAFVLAGLMLEAQGH